MLQDVFCQNRYIFIIISKASVQWTYHQWLWNVAQLLQNMTKYASCKEDTVLLSLLAKELSFTSVVFNFREKNWGTHNSIMQKNIFITFIFNFLSLREESVDARPAAVALANPFGSGEEDRRWVTHRWCAVTEQLLSGHSVDFGCCVVLMMWTAPYTDKITWAITLLYVAIIIKVFFHYVE